MWSENKRETEGESERRAETKAKFQIEKIVVQKKQQEREREEMGNTESGQGSTDPEQSCRKGKKRN